MQLRLRSFATSKHGNRLAECEDSASVSEHRGRFAIADGASQSWAARDWARLLTERWIDEPAARVSDGFEAVISEWVADAQRAFGALDQGGGADVPAYLRAHRTTREGVAHATFVGATIEPDSTPCMRMVGIGDSCGFVVREQALVASVPADVETAVFDSTPSLVMSCGPVPRPVHIAKVAAQPGDRCYLATDALAEVLRDRHASGEPLWDRLDGLTGPGFLDLIDELRATGMENDDVALVVAQLEN